MGVKKIKYNTTLVTKFKDLARGRNFRVKQKKKNLFISIMENYFQESIEMKLI
jgi:hypothetical protein